MLKLNPKLRSQVGWLGGLSVSVFAAIAVPPSVAAERIYISYSVLERSIPVYALETFAKTGGITRELQAYTRYLEPAQLQQFRQALQQPLVLPPVAVAQFLYTPIGEALLQRLTPVIRVKSGPSDFYALRAALILASTDPEGLTALSVLRHFPAQGVQIDLSAALAIWDEVQQLVAQTERAVTALQQQTPPETEQPPSPALPNPRLPGPYTWQKFTLTLNDQTPRRLEFTGQARKYLADVYLPTLPRPQPAPVVVISHGLNSDRSSFAYLAAHLASYGFVVAVPEHPGSNTEQLLALASGRSSKVAEPQEFIDRPLDVTYLLDELDRLSRNNPNYQGRINLNQVGVIGQSFGGYTALVLAGARIDFAQLRQVCPSQLANTLNLSLFLQCQALPLPPRAYQLADPRVKGIVAVNPITSVVLGAANLSQVKIPVMIVANSADTVAPVLLEQIQPFTSLTTPNKYLVLVDNATHFSMISQSSLESEVLPTVSGLIGPAPELAREYLQTMSVAFLKTYVAGQPAYHAYLTPAYVQALSRQPLPLNLVQQFTLDQASR